ncbi:hypothetical protein BGZ81_009923 [Podila clonocystis]|nr:hypothetical protein BGZ81_009923 [Podila clonocystis]
MMLGNITKNTVEYATNTARVAKEAADRVSNDVRDLAGAEKRNRNLTGDLDLDGFELGLGPDSQDETEPSFGSDSDDQDLGLDIADPINYSDAEVLQTMMKWGALAIAPLLFCAIETVVMGYSTTNFGKYEFRGQTVDVGTVFKQFGVKDDSIARLNLGDLTPARLQRFYRYQIQKYLESNAAIEPYLWRKYSTRDIKYRSVTFPGAESLITNDQEAEYLLETYKCMDERLSTNIHDRVKRVLTDRKIIS